jgi:AmmeMemoRadiSam system protein A
MEFSAEAKLLLLKTARKAIETEFFETEREKVDISANPELELKCGAFVTLTINDNLRGCIGYIESDQPLIDTIYDAARHAAFNDPRFRPLAKNELGLIEIEISILTPPEPISSYDEIVIGRHGLIVEENGRRGLLLPQVAVENGFSKEDFLTAICQKAGLNPFLWQMKQIRLSVFTAEIFSEKDTGE